MKKYFLCLIFCICSLLNTNATAVNLANIKANSTELIKKSNVDSLYLNLDKSFKPVYRYLDLKMDQINDMYRIHNDVCQSIDYLEINKNDGTNYFNNHMYWDLRNMSMILDKDQYHKYLKVLNVTLVNKNLMDYLNNND